MKKIISLLLALVLLLCACTGGDVTNTSAPSESQQDTTSGGVEENACADILCGTWFGWLEDPVTFKDKYHELVFTRDGKCTLGDEQLTWSLASVHNDAYCVVAGEYTFFLERNEKGKYVVYLNDRDHLFYNSANFDIVNLTVDNWETYLELVAVHEFVTDENGTASALSISNYLMLKEEYADMFVLPDYIFQYKVDISLIPYTIHFDTQTFEKGEAVPGGDNIGARTNEVLNIGDRLLIGSLLDHSSYEEEKTTVALMTKLTMMQIQGILCIEKG